MGRAQAVKTMCLTVVFLYDHFELRSRSPIYGRLLKILATGERNVYSWSVFVSEVPEYRYIWMLMSSNVCLVGRID